MNSHVASHELFPQSVEINYVVPRDLGGLKAEFMPADFACAWIRQAQFRPSPLDQLGPIISPTHDSFKIYVVLLLYKQITTPFHDKYESTAMQSMIETDFFPLIFVDYVMEALQVAIIII